MEILIIATVAFVAALLTFFSGFGLGTIITPIMLIFSLLKLQYHLLELFTFAIIYLSFQLLATNLTKKS